MSDQPGSPELARTLQHLMNREPSPRLDVNVPRMMENLAREQEWYHRGAEDAAQVCYSRSFSLTDPTAANEAHKCGGAIRLACQVPVDIRRPDYPPSSPQKPPFLPVRSSPPPSSSPAIPQDEITAEQRLALEEAPDWIRYLESNSCPKCNDERGGFKMSCPPICTACGWKLRIHPTTLVACLREISQVVAPSSDPFPPPGAP